MKNADAHKKSVPKLVVFMMTLLALSLFLTHISSASAQEGVATLTSTIYDEGLDSDGDGYFDYLKLGVEVNVTVAGTYVVDGGGFYDTSYNYVSAQTKNSTYLDVGIHVVYLMVDGPEIYAGSVNPTTIASIYLFDESGTVVSELHDLTLPTSYNYEQFQRPIVDIEFNEVERGVVLDQAGSIRVINAYNITNLGVQSETVILDLPADAYDFEVRDESGTLETATEDDLMTVTLRRNLDTNETETLHIFYHIPWSTHINQKNGIDYTLNFVFHEQVNSTIEKLSVSITLPKGAKFQSSTPIDPIIIKKSDLQESIGFDFSNVTSSEDLNFEINYEHDVFWGSFYPTIWVGILVIAALAIFFFWFTPKTIPVRTIQVSSKGFRTFVDSYEEKIRIQSELDSLEERLIKGKIPRRRFKVRKKMLDSRLSTVSSNIASLRETIRASGSQYASMMREIEVAETTLEDAERDTKRAKKRYRRGGISKVAYKKLIEEYNSRIAGAEATIDSVLLRLRE